MDENTSLLKNEDTKSVDSNPYVDDICCCCICQCSTKKTEDLSCCGCFPIKCGLVTIGGLTITLALVLFIEIFYLLLMDDIHWWYVLVALVLCTPLIIAVAFFIVFYSNDTDDSRSRLYVSCMFVIITVVLLAAWNTWYFLAFFKANEVTYGTPESGYWSQSKKQYIFFSIFLAAIISAVYAYFMCVAVTYKNALEPKNKPAAKKDEDAKSNKSNKSKKSAASKKSGSKKDDAEAGAGEAAEAAAE